MHIIEFHIVPENEDHWGSLKAVVPIQRAIFYKNLIESDTILRRDSFHADFKNLIGFTPAISETAKPAPSFQGSPILIFWS